MKTIIRIAEQDDAEFISTRLREADKFELWAAGHTYPQFVPNYSLLASERAWTGTVDGEPVCMFGVSVISPIFRVGMPWLLGTDKVEVHAHAFIRRSRVALEKVLEVCPNLVNRVHVNNHHAIAWLKWLGFTFDAPLEYGPYNERFMRFTLRQ